MKDLFKLSEDLDLVLKGLLGEQSWKEPFVFAFLDKFFFFLKSCLLLSWMCRPG